MKTVTLHGRTFVKSIDNATIVKAVENLAAKLSAELVGEEMPLFVGVLNGSFMFAAELLKNIECPCEVTFVRMNSYSGTSSTGKVESVISIKENVKGRSVIVLEDIVETGKTIYAIREQLIENGAGNVRFASLFFKPSLYKGNSDDFYRAMEIPDDFIVGFGLDYDGLGRNLKDVYAIKE
ncbi:MAG: hypoxanthine phosphoribosyltransferase [Rikenellaceae bacterium]|nr:hypoxanthine phosphoribosyltransferase [Rikenellaceae bacterium]